MSFLKRPALWLGSIGAGGVFYLTIALVIRDILPGFFVSIATGIAALVMIGTISYVLITNSYRKYDLQQSSTDEEF